MGNLAQFLKQQGIKRVFACGLALDFCVLDTALNGVKAGFDQVTIILDAARAAHLPGIGPIGSGFLSPHADMREKMKKRNVTLRPACSLLPMLVASDATKAEFARKPFPEQLGPFPMLCARDLCISMDTENLTYTATEPADVVKRFREAEVDLTGKLSHFSPITLSAQARKESGIPEEAKDFCWAYPVSGGQFTHQQRGYLTTSTPSAAFLVLGGFVYVDAKGAVLAKKALGLGDGGLTFAAPDRWQGVTAPFVEARCAVWFCWVKPGEKLSAEGKEPWNVGSDHGSFVYLFHEDETDKDERDCVFAVSDDSSHAHR